MPVVITVDGFRLFFYSNEGHPREPLHVHVSKAECLAKLWVEPVRTASNYGFNSGESERSRHWSCATLNS